MVFKIRYLKILRLSSRVMQAFLEAGAEMHTVVIEVIDGDHFSRFAVDLAL